MAFITAFIIMFSVWQTEGQVWVPLTHPIHVGLTEVHHNSQAGTLEIVHKLFIDDFEDALKRLDHRDYWLGTEKEIADIDRYIAAYVDRNFIIRQSEKPLKAHMLGKETDFEAIWIYQEIQGIAQLSELTIENHLMMELFDDQKNILHFESMGKRRSFLFKRNHTTEAVKFPIK